MGKKKKTPFATPQKKAKRSRGRPRKERPQVDLSYRQHTPLSNADRMAIVLLAQGGKSPADIADIIGCGWDAAVNQITHLALICLT